MIEAKPHHNNCCVCYTEVDEVQVYQCECGVNLCNACFGSWWVGNIQMQFTETKAVCLGQHTASECKLEVTQAQIDELIKEPSLIQSQIHDALLQKYVGQCQDIRTCPQANCKYAGFMSDQICTEDLKCEKCHLTWRDVLHTDKD